MLASSLSGGLDDSRLIAEMEANRVKETAIHKIQELDKKMVDEGNSEYETEKAVFLERAGQEFNDIRQALSEIDKPTDPAKFCEETGGVFLFALRHAGQDIRVFVNSVSPETAIRLMARALIQNPDGQTQLKKEVALKLEPYLLQEKEILLTKKVEGFVAAALDKSDFESIESALQLVPYVDNSPIAAEIERVLHQLGKRIKRGDNRKTPQVFKRLNMILGGWRRSAVSKKSRERLLAAVK